MATHPKLPIPFEPAQLRPRHDGWTVERQIHFIETLAATKCVDEACRRVGMSDTSAYRLRNRPCGAAFRRAWDAAMDCQLHRVEQSAIERSMNGVSRPVFYKGEQVGEWRHYDERLTMFLLRNRRPARHGRWIEQAPPPDRDEPDPAMRLIRAMDDFEDEDGLESDGDDASAPEPPEQP
jgi:hypothetical protein